VANRCRRLCALIGRAGAAPLQGYFWVAREAAGGLKRVDLCSSGLCNLGRRFIVGPLAVVGREVLMWIWTMAWICQVPLGGVVATICISSV
jgi:hypothetical protein